MVAANFPLSSDLLEPPPDAYPFILNETPYRPLTPDELPRRAFTTDCSPLSSHGESFFYQHRLLSAVPGLHIPFSDLYLPTFLIRS